MMNLSINIILTGLWLFAHFLIVMIAAYIGIALHWLTNWLMDNSRQMRAKGSRLGH